ncbi:MAG: DUF58 domain-containing protein [Isosphaeraceae bacterium]
MIWPTRTLALLALVPALMSFGQLWPSLQSWRAPLLGLDGLLFLLAAIDALTLIGSGTIRASRQVTSIASLGESEDVTLTIENVGGRRRDLLVKDGVPPQFAAEPETFRAIVPGRALVAMDYRLTPRRRGTSLFRRVHLLVSSRLGLWRRSVRVPCESAVRVYPDLKQITRYSILARRDRLSAIGVRRSRRLGTDNEFERLRDYAEGDEPRTIDWRTTARRRKLTVRAYQANQSQRVIFLIDAGRMMAGDVGDGLSPLDHAFNAMLLLAHVALIRGDQVGLLVYSDRVRAFVPPAGGPRRITRLVHAIHNIFPEYVESRHDRAFLELERRCRKRSLVAVLTNVFDDVNAEQIVGHLGNLSGKHLPLGVLLRDRDFFELADSAAESGPGLYRPAAAAAILNWREKVLVDLRRKGVLTIDAFPHELTANLINRYLEIKARHLL